MYTYMDALEITHGLDLKSLLSIVVRDRDVLKSYSERIEAWNSILTADQRQHVGMTFNRCVTCGEVDHFSRWCPISTDQK